MKPFSSSISSSTNPFSSFAANTSMNHSSSPSSSSTCHEHDVPDTNLNSRHRRHVPPKADSSGWISTKKRGRDDTQIAWDQTRVLEARKKIVQRPRAQHLQVREREKQIRQSIYKKRKEYWNQAQKKARMKKKRNKWSSSESGDDDKDHDSDSLESDMESPNKILDTSTREMKQSSHPIRSMDKIPRKLPRPTLQLKTQERFRFDVRSMDSTSSSSSSFLQVQEGITHHLPKIHKQTSITSNDSFDSSILPCITHDFKSNSNSYNKNHSSEEEKKKVESDPEYLSPILRRKRATTYPARRIEDTILLPSSSPKIFFPKDTNQEEDNKKHDHQINNPNSNNWNHFQDEDFVEDEDEAIALQWALKESEKAHKPKVRNQPNYGGTTAAAPTNTTTYRTSNQGKRIILQNNSKNKFIDPSTNKAKLKHVGYNAHNCRQEDDSNEEDAAEVEQDEYEQVEDEIAEREALAVLQAVNALSAQIVQIMVGFRRKSYHDPSTLLENNHDESNSVPHGMIVDGALCLSTLNTLETEKSTLSLPTHDPSRSMTLSTDALEHRWISQADILHVCPNLKLAEYQLIGVNWLAALYGMKCDIGAFGTKKRQNQTMANVNGVLADEMGLGKTVQTIAFIAWLKNKHSSSVTPQDKPHIIIVPASVLSNWEREFKTFSPQIVVVKYHGSANEREQIKERLRRSLPFRDDHTFQIREPLDVVLTTFSYFSSEKADDRNFLRKFEWNYMIVDEAHCLKNPRGSRYRNLDRFDTQRRLLLTGTPVQNKPAELMSLLCFLMPLFADHRSTTGSAEDEEKYGGAHMVDYFVRVESTSGKLGKDATMPDSQENAYKRLKQLLAPFVLRRRKHEVMNQMIPPKTRVVELVPFDEATRSLYDSIIASHIHSRQRASSSTTDDFASQKHLFTSLRKAANHPLLLRTRFTSEPEVEHLSQHLLMYGYFGYHESCSLKLVQKELENFSDYDVHCAAVTLIDENPSRSVELQRYILDEDNLFRSPKFCRLRELLPDLVKQGHRMLIFSQWTRCLDLLGSLMEFIDFPYLRLDGQTSISERQSLIDEFNNNSSIPVFLLSTRAGGMGINLTSADTCILHDLDFNPFNDLQAEDRCHRIGQKRPVTVLKMITKGTVDEDIYEMQERKSRMNAAILENTDARSSTKKTFEDDHEVCNIMKNVMDRYLMSPPVK